MGRSDAERILRELYRARSANDLGGTMKDIADNGVFQLNGKGLFEGAGQPVKGKEAISAAVESLIKTWRFDDWKEVSLLVDGNKAMLHWQAEVTNNVTGKTAPMDGFDLVTFQNGKITNFHQSADTALMLKLASG